MTSSNGNDWFPPVQTDPNESRWIQTKMPLFLIEKIDELAKADFSNRSAAVCKCVASYFQEHSQQEPSLPWNGVSVREGEEESVTTDKLPLQFFPHQQSVSITAVDSAVQGLSTPTGGRDVVGEESEKPPKKGAWKKEFPPCLEEFALQITDFWREKKGSKSERAWKLLMKELSAIHAHLNAGRSPAGKETFLEQLELATANKFQSITLKNFKTFAEGQPGKPQPEEPKHPASQVFRASDQHWPSVGSNW